MSSLKTIAEIMEHGQIGDQVTVTAEIIAERRCGQLCFIKISQDGNPIDINEMDCLCPKFNLSDEDWNKFLEQEENGTIMGSVVTFTGEVAKGQTQGPPFELHVTNITFPDKN